MAANPCHDNIRTYRFVLQTLGLTSEDIRTNLEDNLSDCIKLDRENLEVRQALLDTIRLDSGYESVVREFLQNLGWAAIDINTLLTQNGAGGAKNSRASEKFNRDEFEADEEEFDDLYRRRNPQSLKEAKRLGRQLLEMPNLPSLIQEGIARKLDEIAKIEQEGRYSLELPEDVARIYNKHYTPFAAGMYEKALEYVLAAREELKRTIRSDPQYKHLEPWQAALEVIRVCEEKIQAKEFKEVAERLIREGNWEDAKNAYTAYLAQFDNAAVREIKAKLEGFLKVHHLIRAIVNGTNDPSDLPLAKLAEYRQVLSDAGPALDTSEEFLDLQSNFIKRIKPRFERDLQQLQAQLNQLIGSNQRMIEVATSLERIKQQLDEYESVVRNDQQFQQILDTYQEMKTVSDDYQRSLREVTNPQTVGAEQAWQNMLNVIDTTSKHFSARSEFAVQQAAAFKNLLRLLSKEMRWMRIITNHESTQHARELIQRIREVDKNKTLLRADVEFNRLFNNLNWRLKEAWIRLAVLLLLIVAIVASGLAYQNKIATDNALTATQVAQNAAQTATEYSIILAQTPTPSDTPTPSHTPTYTPTPTLTYTPTPTLTYTPTPLPQAYIFANEEPFYHYLLIAPNGSRSRVYVVNNDPVYILDCVRDENNTTWYQIRVMSDNSEGWLRQEQVDGVFGTVTCRQLP